MPSPLVPNKDNIVLFEWINMPDSTGFGDYHESGTVIPCTFEGKPINYTLQMFLDVNKNSFFFFFYKNEVFFNIKLIITDNWLIKFDQSNCVID